MVQLTLPENSRIKPGKTWPKPANAKRMTEFRIYRWNPDDGANPAHRHLFRRPRRLRADGPRRADLDQIQDRFDAHLPPLLPRGRVRLVRDEHRRGQYARLHPRHRRGRGAGDDLSAAAPGSDQGSGARSFGLLRPARLDRAVAQDGYPGAGEGMAAVAGGAGEARRPLRVHPLRLLLDLLPELLVEPATAIWVRRSCCRPIAGSSTRATKRRASGSTISRIRSASIAATRS